MLYSFHKTLPYKNTMVLRWFCVIIFSSIHLNASAQTKINIRFGKGESKLTSRAKFTIDSFFKANNHLSIDSVHLTGFADSLGNELANKKLAEKRTIQTREYLFAYLPAETFIRCIPIGERKKQIEEKDRRVEILIYSHEYILDSVVFIPQLVKCYAVAWLIVNRCRAFEIKRGKADWIQLECSSYYPEMKNTYYAVKKDSSFQFVKMRWQKKITGRDWWSKPRYVALMPKESFRKWSIGELKAPPCNECAISNLDSIRYTLRTDLFRDDLIYNNMQLKTKFLSLKKAKLRVPALYVDSLADYFMDYDYHKPINWVVKHAGTEKMFYQTEVPIGAISFSSNIYTVSRICREQVFCIPYYGKGAKDTLNIVIDNYYVGNILHIGMDAGALYYGNKRTMYAGIGVHKEWEKAQISCAAGLNDNKKFYTNVRYTYNVLTFPLFYINPLSGWTDGFGELAHISPYFARIYAGTDLHALTFKNDPQMSILSTVHLGFALARDGNRFLKRGFIQYGVAQNMNTLNEKPQPLLTVGVQLHLITLLSQP